jgi:hypothetical protein
MINLKNLFEKSEISETIIDNENYQMDYYLSEELNFKIENDLKEKIKNLQNFEKNLKVLIEEKNLKTDFSTYWLDKEISIHSKKPQEVIGNFFFDYFFFFKLNFLINKK